MKKKKQKQKNLQKANLPCENQLELTNYDVETKFSKYQEVGSYKIHIAQAQPLTHLALGADINEKLTNTDYQIVSKLIENDKK